MQTKFYRNISARSSIDITLLLEGGRTVTQVFKVGILVAVIVGVTAGVYPTNKAAKLAPVDSLRHE
ncbi:hypothetical protein [Methanosarcina horonobensis]|uniref:hypothetical protein n=1 Tax=Methanosarcina horonobensis TaxID=418008 RepID=UPI00069671D0|nr:hypothetical protein [Methanosarcina horonobensis]